MVVSATEKTAAEKAEREYRMEGYTANGAAGESPTEKVATNVLGLF